ncbi:MAG: methyltransferase [Ignavibacteria bacterium RBG_13_36_8]|nr:MAG: methyltransferase [Ignavibacteria bacterium RBG_13_36_8]
MDILNQIADALRNGDEEAVFEFTKTAITENIHAKKILDEGLIAGMNVVGEQFRKHEIFLPEVLLAAKAMYVGMDLLKPLFTKNKIPSQGKVVIGTVHGDLHDLGKNLVGIMLKGAGYEVIDLGKDVPAEKFIETAVIENAHIIGMSALLTTTMVNMKKVTDLLKERGLNKKIKTIIGGAPITQHYANDIGADAYAYDAAKAVECVKELVNAK